MSAGEGEKADSLAVEEEGTGHSKGGFAGDTGQTHQVALRFIHQLTSAGELQLGGDRGRHHSEHKQDSVKSEQDDDEPAFALSYIPVHMIFNCLFGNKLI